jgi:hypothetical protein
MDVPYESPGEKENPLKSVIFPCEDKSPLRKFSDGYFNLLMI